jgi:type I restriction enzyme, S subunit
VVIPKSIKEQQKIASILSKVDELIQKKDEVIKQAQRLTKGLMQKLMTKGIGHTMKLKMP